MLLIDFNTKSKTWHINDQSTIEGNQLEYLIIWSETIDRWAKPHSKKFLKLYKSYSYEAVKFDNGFKSSSHSPHEVPSSDYLPQSYLEVNTSVYIV